ASEEEAFFGRPRVEVPLDSRGLRVAKGVKSLREFRRENVTFQAYDYSCGAAVVSTLLTFFFGEPATEEEVITGLAQHADLEKLARRRAFSLLDVKKFAVSQGYEAVGYAMDLEYLASLQQPAIVPIQPRGYKHFVIVKGILGGRVHIADPAFGNYTRSIGRFLGEWSPRVGFLMEREGRDVAPDEEDLRRQASFMGPFALRGVSARADRPLTTPGDQVQTLRMPRALGGSPLDFFGVRSSLPPGSP
ncbi:MAG: C39 family peptidase, partial [Gemmatimonadota bacterium]|nr:C39 family peptidase [Gemmatimonadota bacterium]